MRLGERVVGGRKLNPADDTLPLHFESGGAAIEGSIAARFGYAAQASSLQGDFTVRDGDGEIPFQGELAAWAWNVPVVSRYSTVWLTPELNADIKLMLAQDQSVAIRFMTAGQTILNVTLSQGANEVRVKQSYYVGTVKIRRGMALRLQPATPLQTGEVFLRGVFSSTNHPRVRYQGALVSWQYAQVAVGGAPE